MSYKIERTNNSFVFLEDEDTWLTLDYNDDGTVSLGVARKGRLIPESIIDMSGDAATQLGMWLIEKTAPAFLGASQHTTE